MYDRAFKCAHCKGDVIISLPYLGESIRHNNKWYHTECFKSSLKPGSRISIEAQTEKTKPIVEKYYWKHWIYCLLVDHYECSCVPNSIYTKLQAIYDGSHEGLAMPIPPEDLADMFDRQMDYLDKNARKKNISGLQRFNYDLHVLMGKYASYLKWKDKQIAEEEDRKQEAEESKHTVLYIKNYVQPKVEEDPLADILEEFLSDIGR